MVEVKEQVGLKDKVTLVLTGPDGKIKDKREVKHEGPRIKK